MTGYMPYGWFHMLARYRLVVCFGRRLLTRDFIHAWKLMVLLSIHSMSPRPSWFHKFWQVEEGCQLGTVDEIASAVNEMLRRIEGEAAFG